jgi:hypothetical protein
MVVYLILFLGMLNWMSFMSSRVLMSLYAIQLGASLAAIGALIALYALGPALLSVHAGKACDRFGSFWPIVIGSGGLAVGFIIVNLTHMVIPLAAGSIGAALGVVTVFFANAALILGGGYAHYRAERKE